MKIGGLTYQEKIAAQRAFFVLLYQNFNTRGEKVYAYLQISGAKMRELKKAMTTGRPYNLRNYGAVIASGFGDPTEEIKQKIAQEFDFKPEYYADITALLRGDYDAELAALATSQVDDDEGV